MILEYLYYMIISITLSVFQRLDRKLRLYTCSLQYVANVYGLLGKILTVGDGGGSIPIDNVDNLSMSSNEDIVSGV